MDHVNLEADNVDLFQDEPDAFPITAIPVVVEGSVRVQEPPATGMVVTQVFLDAAVGPQRVLGEDPRRKIARVVATDQKIRVGTSQKQVLGPDTCAIWPTNTVLEITARSEVWIAADTLTTRVSVVSEQWAI